MDRLIEQSTINVLKSSHYCRYSINNLREKMTKKTLRLGHQQYIYVCVLCFF